MQFSLLKRVTLIMPTDLHMDVKVLAAKSDRTMNEIMVDAVKMYLQQGVVGDSKPQN
ncbi:hypothetical protein STIP37_9 [Synechococcus T7-like phage S-TIP37]|uniref:Uncharacterized protein n=1 Tax=Synechococcus T7-like phage S-TIP37 TaxID=1332145 RepID=A0A345AY90_9CAUD|nr:hypothetical protein HOT80_gp09 [Synechococcus T7-like phage S-TIP37]AXF42070.1 hypothetical protein STIP37_9 [Synechococcus T7-like phage S-TIP37]